MDRTDQPGAPSTLGLTLALLGGADRTAAEQLLRKSTIRPIGEGDNVGHFVVVQDRAGELYTLPIDQVGRVAVMRRGSWQTMVFGMADSGDPPQDPNNPASPKPRGAWSQFALLEALPNDEATTQDGGGYVFEPFVVLPGEGPLRERLYVVVDKAPNRPLNGVQTWNSPRAFLKPAAQVEAAQVMASQACDVLRELGGVTGDLCRRRLVPLRATSPQDSYWDTGRLPPNSGVKRLGFRFTVPEVEGADEPDETGKPKPLHEHAVLRLRSEVVEGDDPEANKGAWGDWRFRRFSEVYAECTSDMTLVTLGLLKDALEQIGA
jgi:hypothetical protein